MYDKIQNAHTEICQDISGLKDKEIAITNESELTFNQIDFGGGRENFVALIASDSSDGEMQVFLDDQNTPIARVTVPNTGGLQKCTTISAPTVPIMGKHKLSIELFCRNGHLGGMNWISFGNVK